MPGSLAQRNAAMSGLPSSGVQQPGGSIPGRFPSNNLPVAMSQVLMLTFIHIYCNSFSYLVVSIHVHFNGLWDPRTNFYSSNVCFSVCASNGSKMIYCVVPLQIPHAHSGVSGRGVNFGGGPAFSSSMNIGGNIQGLSGGSRNSVPGMSVSPSLGNLGPRITSSVGNIVSGSNIGRNISTGGLSIPSIASRMNLSGNAGSGSLNVQGSSRMMNGLLHQQGN